MKELYQSICISDTPNDLIYRFFTLLKTDGVKIRKPMDAFDLVLSRFHEPVKIYSKAEITAIEDGHEKKVPCRCVFAHENDCEIYQFDFDHSLAFVLWSRYIQSENAFLFGNTRRNLAWQFYQVYFYFWQKLCVPRLSEIKIAHEVSKNLLTILPKDLEKICCQYLYPIVDWSIN